MAEVKKGKKARVKASVAQTTAYTFPQLDDSNIIKYYKTAEEIGVTTGLVFIGSNGEEFAELIVDSGQYLVDYSSTGVERIISVVYVAFNDLDFLGEDVVEDDGTVVLDKSGKRIGTLTEYPDAIPTGETNSEGKKVYVWMGNQERKTPPVISEPLANVSSIPKWLKIGIGVIVVVAVFALGFIIYKTQKQPA